MLKTPASVLWGKLPLPFWNRSPSPNVPSKKKLVWANTQAPWADFCNYWATFVCTPSRTPSVLRTILNKLHITHILDYQHLCFAIASQPDKDRALYKSHSPSTGLWIKATRQRRVAEKFGGFGWVKTPKMHRKMHFGTHKHKHTHGLQDSIRHLY